MLSSNCKTLKPKANCKPAKPTRNAEFAKTLEKRSLKQTDHKGISIRFRSSSKIFFESLASLAFLGGLAVIGFSSIRKPLVCVTSDRVQQFSKPIQANIAEEC